MRGCLVGSDGGIDCRSTSAGGWKLLSACQSADRRHPDQPGDTDDQIRSGLTWIAGCADLAGADADRVVQPVIGLAVGQVKDRPDDLAAFRWVGTAVPGPHLPRRARWESGAAGLILAPEHARVYSK